MQSKVHFSSSLECRKTLDISYILLLCKGKYFFHMSVHVTCLKKIPYCGAHNDRVFLEPECVLWELSKQDNTRSCALHFLYNIFFQTCFVSSRRCHKVCTFVSILLVDNHQNKKKCLSPHYK